MIECSARVLPTDVCNLDRPEECPPKQILIEMVDDHTDPDEPITRMYIRHADPNPFADGPINDYLGTNRAQGFAYGQLGDELTDRTFRQGGDGYRLHDVLHLSAMTILGYSPVTRSLLSLRRRSQPLIDRIEDGPRAIQHEEHTFNQLGKALAQGIPVEVAAQWLRYEATEGVQDFLRPELYIPLEEWHKVLSVGGFLMKKLSKTIGTITPKDRDLSVDSKEKMHSAWLYFNRDTPSIHLSQASGRTAMRNKNIIPIVERRMRLAEIL